MILQTENLYLKLTLLKDETLAEKDKLFNGEGADIFLYKGSIEVHNKVDEEPITTFTVEDLLLTAKDLYDSIKEKAESDKNYKLLLEEYNRVYKLIQQLHSLCCIMAPKSPSQLIHFI